MPDMSNHQACPDVEGNGNLSAFNRRPPTTFGVQREAHILERATAAMNVPGHATIIREPSDSQSLSNFLMISLLEYLLFQKKKN